MTLQQIKDSLPAYSYLTPGVSIYIKGDTVLTGWPNGYDKNGRWDDIDEHAIGAVCVRLARRPIPSEVLESQAFWLLHNQLATVAPDGHGFVFEIVANVKLIVIGPLVCAGVKKFNHRTLAHGSYPLLGGEQNIIKHLSQGNLYSVWLSEQLK